MFICWIEFLRVVQCSVCVAMLLKIAVRRLQYSDIMTVPGSIHLSIGGNKVASSLLSTATIQNIFYCLARSLQIPIVPRRDVPDDDISAFKICRLSSILPIFWLLSNIVISQTSRQKMAQSTPVPLASRIVHEWSESVQDLDKTSTWTCVFSPTSHVASSRPASPSYWCLRPVSFTACLYSALLFQTIWTVVACR